MVPALIHFIQIYVLFDFCVVCEVFFFNVPPNIMHLEIVPKPLVTLIQLASEMGSQTQISCILWLFLCLYVFSFHCNILLWSYFFFVKLLCPFFLVGVLLYAYKKCFIVSMCSFGKPAHSHHAFDWNCHLWISGFDHLFTTLHDY